MWEKDRYRSSFLFRGEVMEDPVFFGRRGERIQFCWRSGSGKDIAIFCVGVCVWVREELYRLFLFGMRVIPF